MSDVMTVLKEVQGVCESTEQGKEELQGQIVNIKFNDKTHECYMTKLFILIAVNNETTNEQEYILSFTINNYTVSSVAHYSNVLTLFLYDDVFIHEDNFMDETTKKLYFGDDAYKKFEEYIHTEKGFIKCPVCERYVPKSIVIPETGICKICHEVELPNITFH